MCKISMDRPKLYSFFLTAFSHSLQYTSMSLWAFLKYSLITDSLFHLNIIYMGFLDMFSLIFYLLGLYLSVYIATKISYKSILIYSLLFGSMAFITMPILKWSHYPNLFLLGLIFTVFSFLQGSSFIANGNILVG